MSTIELLVKWLGIKGNTEAKLAVKLGFRSSVTITQWITKGYVPENREAAVITIIKGKKK